MFLQVNEAFDLPSKFRQVRRLLNIFNECFIMTVSLQYILIGSYIQTGFWTLYQIYIQRLDKCIKKSQISERDLHLTNTYCCLIALVSYIIVTAFVYLRRVSTAYLFDKHVYLTRIKHLSFVLGPRSTMLLADARSRPI